MPKEKKEELNEKAETSENPKKKQSHISSSKKTTSKIKKAKQDVDYEKELKLARSELEKEQDQDDTDLGDYTFEEEDEVDDDKEPLLQYNQLTDEQERLSIKKNMAKAHVYLEKFGIQDLEIDSLNHIIIVPFEYENMQFLSHIIVGADWFIVKTSILELDASMEKVEKELFFELLKGNFLLNDVTYSIDPDKKSIWCEADIPANCTYKQFKLHYFSIVFAIDYFIKNISHDLKAPVQSTYHADKSNENLYI